MLSLFYPVAMASPAAATRMKWQFKARTVDLCRVGGLAIYIGILVLIPLLSFGFIPLSIVFDLKVKQLTLLILSVPVFVVGLAEDLGYSMAPKARLVALPPLACWQSYF